MRKHFLIRFPIIIIAATLANILWLLEVLNVSGWNGTAWVMVEQKSIIAICALTALAYLLPLWQNEKTKALNKNKTLAFFSLWGIFFVDFYIGKFVLTIAHKSAFLFSTPYELLLLIGGALLITTMMLYYITIIFVVKIQMKQIIFLMLGVIITILWSAWTVEFFPGYGNSTTFIDAIKMGYPYFWIVVIMGIIGIYSEQKLIVQTSRISNLNEDILDA